LLHKIITPTGTKRKADNKNELHAIKQKLTNFDEDYTPPGTQWDGNNYSCAYDALFAILFNIWATKPKKWKKNIFQESNQYLYPLHDGFQKYLRGVDTLEAARDSVRALLYENDPVLFPSGDTGCIVSALTTQMFYPVYKVPQLHLHVEIFHLLVTWAFGVVVNTPSSVL